MNLMRELESTIIKLENEALVRRKEKLSNEFCAEVAETLKRIYEEAPKTVRSEEYRWFSKAYYRLISLLDEQGHHYDVPFILPVPEYKIPRDLQHLEPLIKNESLNQVADWIIPEGDNKEFDEEKYLEHIRNHTPRIVQCIGNIPQE